MGRKELNQTKTETDDADLHVDNYTFYRKDRNNGNGRGGGVRIFISDNLLCIPGMDLCPREAELLWVEIQTYQKRIIVGVCYRPPAQNKDEQNAFFRLLENSIDNVKNICPDLIVLLGDFNDKCTDWNLPHAHSEIGNKLSNLLTQNNLYQIINEPTRYLSYEPALLDLLITDHPHLVRKSGVCKPGSLHYSM